LTRGKCERFTQPWSKTEIAFGGPDVIRVAREGRTRRQTRVVQNDPSLSKRRWLWPLALAALIFVASSRSEIAGPSVPGSDKVVHFAVYGLLATLVLRALLHSKGKLSGHAAWLSIVLVSAYGISDEWHQGFTPARSVEVADWIADTLGGVLAVALYSRWAWYRRCLEMRLPPRRKPRLESGGLDAPVSAP
jgi:VanZ family protein